MSSDSIANADFYETAKRQLKRCCVPTVVAIAASVTLSSLGSPAVPIALAVACGYAYYRGYRIRIEKKPAQPQRRAPTGKTRKTSRKGTS